MNKLRIVSKNIADSSTLTGTGIGIDNLKLDSKTRVWRTQGSTAQFSVAFPIASTFDCITLPFTNLSSSATISVVLYLRGQIVKTITSSPLCIYTPLTLFEWGIEPLGTNAYNEGDLLGTNTFSMGGGSYGVLWFDTVVADEVSCTITDNYSDGYIDISRLVIGQSWSPKYNAEYGVEVSEEDNGKQYRTDSGDSKFDTGARYKKLTLDLAHMVPEDRNVMWGILKRNGIHSPVFITVFPENSDNPILEQMHQVYGKLSSTSVITASYYNRYSTKLEIEEN